LLGGLKQLLCQDRLVLALVNLAAINDLADVKPVLQKMPSVHERGGSNIWKA
jgi:hypothetical protein